MNRKVSVAPMMDCTDRHERYFLRLISKKTLLYTEGLGREFNPELDLWKTSRPILERWMKEQKGPKVIAKKVFNNLDSYMEILPEIPSFFRRISNQASRLARFPKQSIRSLSRR